jgi:hypothetical protein
MQRSLLSWMLMALGFKYAILLSVSALAVFVLTLIVVLRGKGAMAGAALVLILPVPLLIGVCAAIEGGIRGYLEIAVSANDPAARRSAELLSTMLVPPMVGMALMAPSYILAILGTLVRSLSADGKGSGEAREL